MTFVKWTGHRKCSTINSGFCVQSDHILIDMDGIAFASAKTSSNLSRDRMLAQHWAHA